MYNQEAHDKALEKAWESVVADGGGQDTSEGELWGVT